MILVPCFGGIAKIMVEIVIPRPPSTNRLWRIGRGRMFRSAAYDAWLDECVAMIKQAGVSPVKGKYKLVVCVRRPDKRRRDLDNVSGKALNDMLQKAGIVEDDCLCQMMLCAWTEDGPDTVISICSEGEEHELSAAIERALQGGAAASGHGAKDSPRGGKATRPAPAFGTMSHKEYLAAVSASRPSGGKRRKGNR